MAPEVEASPKTSRAVEVDPLMLAGGNIQFQHLADARRDSYERPVAEFRRQSTRIYVRFE